MSQVRRGQSAMRGRAVTAAGTTWLVWAWFAHSVAAQPQPQPQPQLQPQPQPQPTATLAYEVSGAASGCPADQVLRDLVVARVGYDPFDAHAAFAMRVAIQASEHELVGAVELRATDGVAVGRREIHGTPGHCDALVEALSIAAGIALEALVEPAGAPTVPPDGAVSTPEPPDPETPPSVRPAPAHPPTRPPSRRPLPEAEHGPRVDLSLGPIGRVGASPSPAWGVAVSASVEVGTFTVGVEGSFATMPSASTVSGGVDLRTSLLSVGIVPCYVVGIARACLVMALGSLESEAQVAPDARVASTLFAYAGARLGAVLPLGRHVAVGGHVDLAASLVRASFDVGATSIWKNGPVLGELGLSVILTP